MILYLTKIIRLSLKHICLKQSQEAQDGTMDWVRDAKSVSGSGKGRIYQKSQGQRGNQEVYREEKHKR